MNAGYKIRFVCMCKVTVITGQSDNRGKVHQFQPNNAFKPGGKEQVREEVLDHLNLLSNFKNTIYWITFF